MRRARPWAGSGSASGPTCPRLASSRAWYRRPSTRRCRPPPRSRSTPRSTGSRRTRSTSTAATGAAGSSAPCPCGAEAALKLHQRIELEAREGRVRHARRAVDEVHEVTARRERERIQQLVVHPDHRPFHVGPAQAEVAVGEGGDRRLLTEVLVEPVERPVALHLRLPEAQPGLPAVRIVGRRLPVVDVIGEQTKRLVQDEVRDRHGHGGIRLVEGALVARDRAERGRLLSALRRRGLDGRHVQQVAVEQAPVEVGIDDRLSGRVERRRVLVQRLGDQIGVEPPVLPEATLHLHAAEVHARVDLPPEHPAVLLVGDLGEGPLETVHLHLVEGAERLLEELEGLTRALHREIVVEDHLADAEDRVRELAPGEARDAGPQVEARPGREGQVGPVEIEVLAVEVPGERLVGRDRVVRVAGGAPDGRRQLVGEGDPHAEPGADALAVARRHDGALLVGLVVEALVPVADVAEDGGALEPVGQLDRLLRLGGRRLALLGGLLHLLLRRLADRLLLVELVAQLLHLVLGLTERLLQLPEPLLRGGLGAPGNGNREQHRDDRTDQPALHHRPSVRFGFPHPTGSKVPASRGGHGAVDEISAPFRDLVTWPSHSPGRLPRACARLPPGSRNEGGGRMRRRWWFAGLLALGLVRLAHAATLVTGAGATFPYPLYSKWFDEFHKRNPDLQLNYQSIGSGGGIRQVLEGTVDFGATDGPMTDEQLRAAPVPILHLPTALGAVVPTYNLPGVERVRCTPEALAGILLGQITHWNDPALTKENPNIALPAAAIVPIHRSDGSGTTYIFTDYLAKVSPEWQKGVGRGTSVNWPVGLGGKGNEGVAGLVKQTPNAIGYVELIYAVQNKLPYGDVRNRSGKFVQATLESVTAAAAAAAEKMPEDFRVSITDPAGAD